MQEQLFNLCKEAMENAYIPYSNFPVGAAMLTKDGKTFIGANIENAAYPSCICAERSCITTAYSNGYRQSDIKGFAIITDTEDLSSPCGECRQVLGELLEQDTPLFIFTKSGKARETTIAELLPYGFNSKDLDEALN